MSFTCPRCGAVSHNPNDARERYCGRCHVFVDDETPPGKRHAGKPSYHQYARATPLRPVTMPPIGFGKKDKR